jgi:hypothetical protein
VKSRITSGIARVRTAARIVSENRAAALRAQRALNFSGFAMYSSPSRFGVKRQVFTLSGSRSSTPM